MAEVAVIKLFIKYFFLIVTFFKKSFPVFCFVNNSYINLVAIYRNTVSSICTKILLTHNINNVHSSKVYLKASRSPNVSCLGLFGSHALVLGYAIPTEYGHNKIPVMLITKTIEQNPGR